MQQKKADHQFRFHNPLLSSAPPDYERVMVGEKMLRIGKPTL
jgi:hypothetical protein